MWFRNIFSTPVACLKRIFRRAKNLNCSLSFPFLMMSLEEQKKFLILMKTNLFMFSSVGHAFDVLPKKSFLMQGHTQKHKRLRV